MIRRTPRRLVLALGVMLSLVSAKAETVNIATSSNPVKTIVIPIGSGTALQATADELKGFLNRMKSGTSTFVVQTFDPAVGPAANTIVLGKAADLNLVSQLDDPTLPADKEREHFLVAAANTGSNIVIAGNTDIAISNGVYELLGKMGCAWFMPTAAWEIVPAANATVRWTTPATPLSSPTVTMGTKSMALKIYHQELPDYKARALTRVYTNSLGTTPLHEWIQQWNESVMWDKRNRNLKTLKINNFHGYGQIIIWAQSQTQAPNDPVNGRWKREYYALVNGQRGDPTMSNADERIRFQLCVANPEVVQLCKDYATAYFAANPNEDSISMEPNDGVNRWCECTDYDGAGPGTGGCMDKKWGGISDSDPSNDDTFVTDRVVYLANEVAKVIPSGKYVGMLSYGKHSGWPSIPVEPNVYVSMANAYLTGGMTMPLLLSNWAAKWAPNTPNIGIRDYFSLWVGDYGLPNLSRGCDHKYIKQNFSTWHSGTAHADIYAAESSSSMGMLGLGQYLACKVLWNVDADVEALRKDFLVKCFGADTTPIYATMDQFYKHIDRSNGYMLSTDLIGRLFGWINTAYGQTSDAKVLERLDNLAVWLKYCEMRRGWEKKTFGTRQAEAEAIYRFLWKVRSTSMIDSPCAWKTPGYTFGNNGSDPSKDEFDWPLNTITWHFSGGTQAAGTLELTENMPWDIQLPEYAEGHPWKDSGTNTYTHAEIVQMVTDGIVNNPTLPEEPRIYSHDLIPGGFSGTAARGGLTGGRRQKIGLYLRTGTTGVFPTLTLSTNHTRNRGDIPYNLYATDAMTVLQTGTLTTGTVPVAVTFLPETPDAHYIFDMDDLDANSRLLWDAGEKVSMMARSDWPYTQGGTMKRYFYVPKGTKRILAYAYELPSCTAYPLMTPSATRTVTGSGGVDIDISITDTEDEQIWCVYPFSAEKFFFQNIPGVLAARPDELLLPKEAFEELIASGGSGTATRGTFQKMNGTNAFYLRGDALGILPTLSITGTLSGTNTGTSTWKLLSEDGKTEFVSGTFVRTSSPVTYTIPINSGTGLVPTSMTDTFLLVYNDNKTISPITWDAGAKVTIAATKTYPHWQVGSVSRRYFFVPRGTQTVSYQSESISDCDVYTLSGTKKYDQAACYVPSTTEIPVGPGEDNQFWYFYNYFIASGFQFTTIPGGLAARPDELLVPKWTTMAP